MGHQVSFAVQLTFEFKLTSSGRLDYLVNVFGLSKKEAEKLLSG